MIERYYEKYLIFFIVITIVIIMLNLTTLIKFNGLILPYCLIDNKSYSRAKRGIGSRDTKRKGLGLLEKLR